MDTARHHWEILRRVPDELARRVWQFMVIGDGGDGVLLLTENGEGYRFGKLKFGKKSKQAMKPKKLEVPKLVSMAHGLGHILLLDEDGQIHSMGKNDYGQLGLGTVDGECHFSPQLIPSSHKFISVRCGPWHSLALTEGGDVLAWGNNCSGQIGVPRYTTNPHPFLRQVSELDLHQVVAIECGGFHSLALTDRGEVYAWGANKWGQMGNENGVIDRLGHQPSPTRISTPSPIKSIAAGLCHTLLLTQTGEVYACGDNRYCQLGLPTSTEFSGSLVKVVGLSAILHIESHFETHLSIAMTAKRECFVWGHLSNTSLSIPFQLCQNYSTLDSVHSFRSNQRNTPYSVRVEGLQCPRRTDPESRTESRSPSDSVENLVPGKECNKKDSETQTESRFGPHRLINRILQKYPSPDLRFDLRGQFIWAHRSILQISSDYFDRFFSKSFCFSEISQISFLQSTVLPSEPNPQTPFITISIPNYSYSTFDAYIRFLYRGTFELPAEQLPELFELASSHFESDLAQLCLARMRSTVSPENCFIFYQLTERHPLPEFQLELRQFIDNLRR